MYATDSNQFDNININIEKVDAEQFLALDSAENFKVVIPILKKSFENMGYENINYEVVDIENDGKNSPHYILLWKLTA